MDTATQKESWDDRIAREKRENNALRAGFVAKLHEVDLPGWVSDTKRFARDDDSPHSVTFTHTETGAKFWVSLPGTYASRDGKVEAHAEWPNDADGGRKSARDWGLHGYSESDPYQIGFSYKKTVKAITSDLNRRLVGPVLEGIAIVNEKLAAQKAKKGSISTDVEILTAAFSSSDVREQTYFSATLHFDGGDARLSNYNPDGDGNTVDLTLNNLTVEQTVAIAELLKS